MIRPLHLLIHKWRKKKSLPILMWHKILPESKDQLTITESDFKLQLSELQKKGFTPISLSELKEIPPHIEKPILLTFDDAYENNATYAYPHLKINQMKAAMFLPVSHLGKSNTWDEGEEKLLNFNQLPLYQDIFDYGLHSYAHTPYSKYERKEISDDIYRCYEELEKNQITYFKMLAYPYGKRPTLPETEKIELLQKLGIEFTFRIGNRFNHFPLNSPYDLERFDVTPRHWKQLFNWL